MKIAILFACLTLLVAVEHVQGQYYYASCQSELEACLDFIRYAYGECKDTGCPMQCTCSYLGINDSSGTITVGSFMKAVRERFSSSLVGKLEALISRCLGPFGGSLSPSSGCDQWTAFANCVDHDIKGLCSGRMWGWGWDGPWGSWGRK